MFKKTLGAILAATGVCISTALGGLITVVMYMITWMVFDPNRIGTNAPSVFLQIAGSFLLILGFSGPVIGFVVGLYWAKGLLKP